jgi:phosphohistidine phosphatase
MKTLLVMRHAAAVSALPGQADHDRPLSPEGVIAAGEMGRVITRLDLVPGLVMASTATRARRTAELAIAEGGWVTRLELEPSFYRASVEEVVTTLATAPEVERLMVVGHQPAWGELVAHLTGEPVVMGTATVAVIGLPAGSWRHVLRVRGTLEGVHHPVVP